jgi:hypothetical protein
MALGREDAVARGVATDGYALAVEEPALAAGRPWRCGVFLLSPDRSVCEAIA